MYTESRRAGMILCHHASCMVQVIFSRIKMIYVYGYDTNASESERAGPLFPPGLKVSCPYVRGAQEQKQNTRFVNRHAVSRV